MLRTPLATRQVLPFLRRVRDSGCLPLHHVTATQALSGRSDATHATGYSTSLTIPSSGSRLRLLAPSPRDGNAGALRSERCYARHWLLDKSYHSFVGFETPAACPFTTGRQCRRSPVGAMLRTPLATRQVLPFLRRVRDSGC